MNQNLKAGGVSGTSRMPIPTELVYVWRDVEGAVPYGDCGIGGTSKASIPTEVLGVY